MSAAFAKFTTWGQHEINGLEALDSVRKIWRTGEEEGYWSEFVFTFHHLNHKGSRFSDRRGQLAADAAHVAAAHSEFVPYAYSPVWDYILNGHLFSHPASLRRANGRS